MVTSDNNYYAQGLTSLYYLLICADKTIDMRELEMGKTMIEMENLDVNAFYSKIDFFSSEPDKIIYNTCIQSLRNCSETERVRSLAWMKLIANSDGDLDDKEFDLIQHICINEFKLNLNQVLKNEESLRAELKSLITEDKL